MDRFIARANIDHYLYLLGQADLGPEKRAAVTKMLIEEEDKLSRDLEHLEFAQVRAATGRDRLNGLRQKRDGFAEHSAQRATAERLIANFEGIQQLLDDFCHHLQARVNGSRL